MSRIDKWRDQARKKDRRVRGPRGSDPKGSQLARLTHPASLPHGTRQRSARIDDKLDLGTFDDLEPDQDFMILPSGAEAGQVYVVEIDAVSGEQRVNASPPELIAQATDGNAPSASPTPTVRGGIRTLFITWTGVANDDPTTVEVHVSETTGFTPGAGTLVGESRGTIFVADALTDESPLAYDTDYFVKLVAKDDDGSAAASSEASAQLSKVDSPDITANAITAIHILAESIASEHLEAELVLTNSIIAGDPMAGHLQMGVSSMEGMEGMVGLHAIDTDGETITFMIDAETGQVYVHGRLDFGFGSRINNDDTIDIYEQALDWQVPALRQAGGHVTTGAGASTIAPPWPSATQTGNLLLLVVALWDADGTPPTPTNPSGWGSPIVNTSRDGGRLVVWKIEGAASRSGSQSITLNDTVNAVGYLIEFTGTGVQDVAAVAAQGDSTLASTGTSDTTTQDEELWVGFVLNFDDSVAAVGTQENPTNDFTQIIHSSAPPTPSTPKVRLGAYTKNVTAIGTANTEVTLGHGLDDEDWIGAMLTFKAKAAGVAAPDPGLVRIYTDTDRFDREGLYWKDSAGQEHSARELGRPMRSSRIASDFTGHPGLEAATGNARGGDPFYQIMSGTNADVEVTTDEPSHPGVWSVAAGTTSSGDARVVCSGYLEGVIRYTVIIKTPINTPDGTNSYRMLCGLGTSGTGLAIQNSSTTAAGTWQLSTIAGTDALDDNGGAVDVVGNTWYTFELLYDNGAVSVWIDGIKKVTDFATGDSSRVHNAGVRILKSAGTGARTMKIDYMAIEQEFPAPR